APPPASVATSTPTSYETSRPSTTSTVATASSLSLPRACSTWVIEKLSEGAAPLALDQVQKGIGRPKTIPITGTEWLAPDTRSQQAYLDSYETLGELEAFKLVMRQGCISAPRLLGYIETEQGREEAVPGGFIKYLVPGESLTQELFWSLDCPTRDDIRARCRVALKEVLCCHVVPQMSAIPKMIYEQFTGNVYVKRRVLDMPERFTDNFQSNFGDSNGMANSDTFLNGQRLTMSHPDLLSPGTEISEVVDRLNMI
ncbi:hypothetical protein N7539_007157, partial [Penicillium diatomitis]